MLYRFQDFVTKQDVMVRAIADKTQVGKIPTWQVMYDGQRIGHLGYRKSQWTVMTSDAKINRMGQGFASKKKALQFLLIARGIMA